MNFEAAIFDLDGTLLDSMNIWEYIDISFLKKRSLPVPGNYVTEICARSFEEAAQYTIDLFGGMHLCRTDRNRYVGLK